MVAIVSGIRTGLDLGSREVLGPAGVTGNALEGRNGQGVYVNIANGMLVVQDQDDDLVARGPDAEVLRTYNSGGTFNDDNGDNWASGVISLRLSGTLSAAGSTVQKVDRDGSTATYSYDTSRGLYVTTEGGGAYDTLSHVAADNQFEWRDGSTGATQRFEGSGLYRLLSARDPSGNALTYAYGAGGFLSSVTTAGGDSVCYDYTGSNLTQVRTVAGGTTTTRVRYAYDASNRLATVTVDLTPADNSVADGKVYRTSYTYDGTSKRIAGITQSDGTSLAFTYVDAGGGNLKLATVRDGLNQTTSFSYGTGYTTVTDPLGLVTRYDYDGAGQLTRITGPAVSGVTASRQFAYNSNGDLTSVTDGEGRIVVFQYDANGNQVLQRDAAGDTVTRVYDARNQLVNETTWTQPDPDGAGAAQPGGAATARQVYDAAGRNLLRFAISAEGRVTEYRYDGFGQRTAAITYAGSLAPYGSWLPTEVPAEAQVAQWAAAQDLTTTQRVDFAYDGRGQLLTRTAFARVSATGDGVADGTQSVERHVRDAAGQLLQTVSATNGSTCHTYDGLGRLLMTTDALGQVTVTQYDDAGRKTLVTLANGLVTTNSYDAAGRLVSVVQSGPAGVVLGETRYFYDADNRLRMTQDPTGVRSWILYDEAGRKAADIDGNGSMTEYAYDRSGLLISSFVWSTAVNTALLVDAGGQPVISAVVTTVRPAVGAGDYASWRQYDSAGRLVREAASSGLGTAAKVTEWRYDGASRLSQILRYATPVSALPGDGKVAPGSVALPPVSAQDRCVRNFYDGDGRLAGTLDAEGYLTVFRYTGAGQLCERIAYATATSASLRGSGTLAQLLPASSADDIREVTLYDGQGRAIAQVDGEGYLTETVYDGNGNATQTIRYATRVAGTVTAASLLPALRPPPNPADRATLRSFDALNRLTQETSAEGVLTQSSYDSVGNLVSTVRAAGSPEARSLLARYDLQGRLVAELSAQGAALLTGGQTQAQVDAIWAQYATAYAYDAASRRTSATDPLGQRTLFFYDADGQLTHTVNALGEVRETRYDARGRITDTIAYAGRIATVGLSGGLVTATLTSAVAAIANAALDSRASVTYTRDSQVATRTDAAGALTTSAYDVFGDEISRQFTGSGVNFLETYTVDRRGLRTGTVQDAAGVNAVASAVYDAFGRLVRSVDANGNVREQAWDRLGRVVTTRDPLNALRSTSYDAFGRTLTQTDALGNVTRTTYDAMARAMTVTTAEGIASTTTSTRHGQVQSVSDGKGQVTTYRYDLDGNLVQTSTPLTTSSTTYDAADRLVDTTDASGNKVAYAYDAANRVLTRRVDPDGLNLVTTYQYDGKGQRVSVTDARGIVTTTEYDRRGLVTKQTVDPTGLNLQTVYSYDARGKVLTVRSPGGTVTQTSYDALGRRVQERVDPTGLNLQRNWTYDRNGNVLTATDARGNVTRYAYDADDRLVFTVDPLGNLRQTGYDAEGRVTKTAAYATPISLAGLPAAPTATQLQGLVIAQATQDDVEYRVYDKDGRAAATVDGTGAVVRYSYDANGNVVARTAYATRIDLASWVPGTVPAPAADAAHDATTRTVYDALDRAIYTMDGIGAVVAQSYDGNGNVVRRTAYATAIPTNTSVTSPAIAAALAAVSDAGRDATVRDTYDAAGRLTWRVDGSGAVTQKVYDREGNLVRQVGYATAIAAGAAASSVVASGGDRMTTFAYDAANRLVIQVDALKGVTEQVLDADGNVARRTAYANAIATVPPPDGANVAAQVRAALLRDPANDRNSLYGFDAAGRQVLAMDALGAVTETQYDGTGNATATIAYANLVDTSGLATAPTLSSMRSLVTTNAAVDRSSRSTYDAAGRRVYSVDPTGAVTSSQYDGVGRLTRSTRFATTIPDGTAATSAAIAAALHPDANRDQDDAFQYNAAGQRIASTDALGGLETFTYDALGHKLSFTNKNRATWTYTYDAAGRMLSETTPQVQLTSAGLDGNGHIVLDVKEGARIVTRMAYDALGNSTQRTEAAGRPEERTTRYEYDPAGRQVRVIYPPVCVYNAAGDAVTTNGATGVASRVENLQALETRTFYDALGNAVANRDVGGAISQKVYDCLGRLVFEIDALGYVTRYSRNAFGDVTSLVRYGTATALAGVNLTAASQAASRAQVDAALGASGFDHGKDRTLLSVVDRAGRVVERTEPSAYVYDSSPNVPSPVGNTGGKTRNVYDAFGQLVQQRKLRNAGSDTWVTTTHYFDRAGREAAIVDALGYLTLREFDAAGNLTKSSEFATAVPAGWSVGGYGLPPTTGDDRVTIWVYDRLSRKTGETRIDVEFSAASDGSSTRGSLTTAYEYDAVGNPTRVVDAAGNATITYYDAVGRVTAVAAPPRSSTLTGATLTPLTAFRRDAYGNVVAQTEFANGTVAATTAGYTPAVGDSADRTTTSVYDSFGRSIQTTDANGSDQFFSYDASGHVAKQWQGVTGNDGVTRTAFALDSYDKLGHLVETRSPASTSVYQEGAGISTVSQAQAGLVVASTEYDAFGEITRKGTQGGRQEYFEYDNAGRLWRTNSGDGVDRIHLYDALGNVTAEIRSSGSGRDNLDIKTFANAQAAAENPYTRRVDIQYDALGRVTARLDAVRQELQGGVSVQRQYTTGTVRMNAADQADESGHAAPGAMNEVALTWNSLSQLGSGDIKVTIEYRTAVHLIGGYDENYRPLTSPGTVIKSYTSGVLVGDAAAAGATLRWGESTTTADLGISAVTRIVVFKKDRYGNWRTALDQAPGYGANEILVAAPPDPGTTVALQLRAPGSPGDTGWWPAELTGFGSGSRFDAAGLAPGSYEYRVVVTPPNGTGRVTASGTLSLTQPPLNNITVPIAYGRPGTVDGVMSWSSPGSSYNQVFRYRPNGSSGAWSALAVASATTSLDGVDTRGLAAGTYQFELLWSLTTQGVPTAHATGTFTVVAAKPAYWVAPVNLAPITGLQMGTGLYGARLVGWQESGVPIYDGGTTVPALVWNAANATVARYRAPGGAWQALAINSDAQVIGESGPTGTQKVLLNGVPPGTYQVEILAGSPPTAQATANLTVYAQNPGSYVTVYVQVPTQSPVVSYYAPVYETRYGTRTASYTVWVNDPPVIIGYGEGGAPIYSYPGHWETRYYTQTYSYQVQVGQRPVYATDENGNIIYQTVWVTQAQQQWVPGTTPAPTISVTTPPYTPGYWVGATPAQFGDTVATASGSAAISTAEGSVMAQSASQNGDSRWLRPTLNQKTDRWGNVIEITDPRNAAWKTTYKYNASSQLVRQTLPDAGTGAAPTSLYYDRLGRQVAVRDANGNVNGQVFDAAGNLVTELHADGGVVSNAFNAFGERVRTTDALGKPVGFSYDRMGHLLRTTKAQVGVYRVNLSNGLEYVGSSNIVESWTYDQLGRKLTRTNGNGEKVSTSYDLAGNIVATLQPLGQAVRAAYDAQGRKIAEVDANGNASTWSFDYFGLLTGQTDLGGARYTYNYDNARQLIYRGSSRGQSITYGFDAAGQVTSIRDWANDKTTTYVYDLSGRKLRERVVQGGVTYQDNFLAYDARGNLRDVADGRAHVAMEYDKAGNRSRVATFVDYRGTGGETASSTDRYFRYDTMNRQVVVDAVDAAGNLGTQGHQIAHDRNGNRTSDTYWGPKVVTTGGQQVITGYNEDGSAIYTTTPADFTAVTGYSTEVYGYDNLNRLQSVVKDGVQIDVRRYDGADRVIQSGPVGALPVKYADIINQGLAPDQMNGKETRVNRYDADGRLMHQMVLKSDNSAKLNISWDPNESNQGFVADGYDAAGNVVGYTVTNHDAGVINEYTSTILRYEGYQQGTTHGSSSRQQPGDSTQQYDANGFLVGVVDSTQPANNRIFVNDASGHALFVSQAGNVQRQLVVNGEVLGRYGVGVDPTNPAAGYNNSPNFANVSDFDFGYARVSASYPAASPGAYITRSGDTLQSIAQTAYGDSSLWYRIAEANGLGSNSDLKVGQTLNIPNRVSTINNNSTTFKPYDPSKIEGDKTPSLATPVPKKQSNWLGQLLAVVAAVVVAYLTGYFYLQSLGTATVAGGGTVTATLAGAPAIAAGGTWTTSSLVMAGAAGGAAGSIAGQLVGMATGAQDGINWKQVGLSAVSGGVSMGLGGFNGAGGVDFGAGEMGNRIVQSAVGNAVSQGIGVVTGLQHGFDWRGVAASAFGTASGASATASVADAFQGNAFAQRLALGLVAGGAAAVARGGRVVVQQVAVDAFGNAVGQSIADEASATSTRTLGASSAPAAEYSTGYSGGLKVSNGLYEGLRPKFNVADPLVKPAWDLYADGTPGLSAYQGAYDDDVAVSMPVEDRRPYVIGRPLADLPPIPRRATPEPNLVQSIVAGANERLDAIRARLDLMGEDPSTPEPLRFAAAMARGPGNWIPEAGKFVLGVGGYALDSQIRSQVNTMVGNFLTNDPMGATEYAATRYWDDHSLLEVGADTFNLVAGGSISAPFGRLGGLALKGTLSAVSDAGETALRWTQRLSDYSIEFPSMRPQVLYSFAGAVDPRVLSPTIRNLRAEAMALAPEGFEVVRISRGAVIMRYGDDAYYSVPKGQYSLIPDLRMMDTMGDVFTKRVQGIADSFDARVHLTFDQRLRLDATPDGWLKEKFMSAYKGSWTHGQFGRALPDIPGASSYRYSAVGPDVVSRIGETGLKYEITQQTSSLSAVFSHTRKYPGELLRYVTYR